MPATQTRTNALFGATYMQVYPIYIALVLSLLSGLVWAQQPTLPAGSVLERLHPNAAWLRWTASHQAQLPDGTWPVEVRLLTPADQGARSLPVPLASPGWEMEVHQLKTDGWEQVATAQIELKWALNSDPTALPALQARVLLPDSGRFWVLLRLGMLSGVYALADGFLRVSAQTATNEPPAQPWQSELLAGFAHSWPLPGYFATPPYAYQPRTAVPVVFDGPATPLAMGTAAWRCKSPVPQADKCYLHWPVAAQHIGFARAMQRLARPIDQIGADFTRPEVQQRIWKRYGRTAKTAQQLEALFRQRFAQVNLLFTEQLPGWQSDAGAVWLVAGPPGAVARTPEAAVWLYASLNGGGEPVWYAFDRLPSELPPAEWLALRRRGTVAQRIVWQGALEAWYRGRLSALFAYPG